MTRLLIAWVLLSLSAIHGLSVAASSPEVEIDPELMIALGKRVYHEGRLSSGEPVKAFVAGDVPVSGDQFTCVNCHRRSGMGSTEGQVIASMVTQDALYRPQETGSRRRFAYTDDTLARSIREAIDPEGQPFDPAMPAYDLPDLEMEALIAYIKTLSARVSPGVTPKAIHFATVVTEGVDPSSMLEVLEVFFEEKNRKTRNEVRRAEAGPFYRRNVNEAYREWILHTWELTGPPGTWRSQLESRYERQPVFAMISGMTSGTWAPMHRFCEEHQVPCILPNVDLPVISPDGYYTLYFSEGLFLEARVMAAHLAQNGTAREILQIFGPGLPGAAAAGVLRRELKAGGDVKVSDFKLARTTATHALTRRLDEIEADGMVLWLSRKDLAPLEVLLAQRKNLGPIYLSSTLLGGDIDAVPDFLRKVGFLAHPYALPDDFAKRFRRIGAWIDHRGMQVTNPRIAAQTYFACMVLGDALMHIKFDHFYRDYFLELIDHLTEVINSSAAHPNPSFGPGQRYISKGCYIVEPRATDDELGPPRARWIVP